MRKDEVIQRRGRIIELYDKGLNQTQIASRLGVTPCHVGKILRNAGIKTVGSGCHGGPICGAVGGSTGYRVAPHFIEHGNGHQEY